MKRIRPWLTTCTLLALVGAIALAPASVLGGKGNAEFTQEFFIESCTFETTGTNPFFVLQPGAQLVLGGYERKEYVEVTITVLDETKDIDGVTTRVVREEETKDGVLIEVSWNYFAVCKETNSVVYFGEDVDICDAGLEGDVEDGVGGLTCEGGPPSHEGAWLAFDGANMPGIIMPGTILLGSRYFQEIAPDVAMDRAEHVGMNETVETGVDTFEGCLKVKETTPLEPNAKGFKFYAPGIGLVKDGELVLIDSSSPQ